MSSFRWRREYRGDLKAVVVDWAGTVVDYASRAPVAAITEGFERRGIRVTEAQAREPMGRHKREHLRLVATMPEVADQWRRKYGRPPSDDDVQELFDEFVPIQIEVLPRFAEPIARAVDAVARFRARGLAVGSSTGYTREMMACLSPEAARLGYEPDVVVCASDVPAGRPAPWMLLRNAQRLGVYPLSAVVKIGDTVADVEAGLNAGCWTIAISRTGNELGLLPKEQAKLAPVDLEDRLEKIATRLHQAGAHYVVDSLAECERALDEIEGRLALGYGP